MASIETTPREELNNHNLISRRKFLQIAGAVSLAVTTDILPIHATSSFQTQNVNTPIDKQEALDTYEQEQYGFYTVEDMFVLPFSEFAEVYAPNTNLKLITALDENNKSQFSLAIPVGSNYIVGEGEEIFHSSWFEEVDGHKEFLVENFVRRVLVPIWDIHKAARADGLLREQDHQRILFHTGSQQTAFKRSPKILCNQPMNNTHVTWVKAHNIINQDTPSKEEEYEQAIQKSAVAHEWFHECEYVQIPPDIYGSEAFANAYMIHTGQNLGLLSSDQEQQYRNNLATSFFANTSVEMKPLFHNIENAGYEHMFFIEWLMQKSGLSWAGVISKLKTLPCEVLPIGPSQPFEHVFEEPWPESFGIYLAHVLIPPGVNRHDSIFDPLRRKFSEHARSLIINETIVLKPNKFAFYLIDQNQDPHRYYSIHSPEGVILSTFTESIDPVIINPGSALEFYKHRDISRLPVAMVNTGTTDAHISVRPKPDTFELQRTHLPQLIQ